MKTNNYNGNTTIYYFTLTDANKTKPQHTLQVR